MDTGYKKKLLRNQVQMFYRNMSNSIIVWVIVIADRIIIIINIYK